MKKTLSNVSNLETVLSDTEKEQIKGGILLTCEEKRHTAFGMTYTTQKWSIQNDGRLLITVKM